MRSIYEVTCKLTSHPFSLLFLFPPTLTHTLRTSSKNRSKQASKQPTNLGQMEKRKSFVACSLVKENPTKLKPFEASLKARQSEDDNHGDTSSLSFKSCELGNNRPSDAHHSKGQETVLRCLPQDAMNIHDMHEKPGGPETILDEDDCGRERLKRHRIEMAGRVWIPDIWGQEELLKDWIDCSAFDSSLVPGGIMSARAALVEEGRRANSGGLRIQYRC